MRRRHFETLRPVCPVCRGAAPAPGSPLRLAHVIREADGHILEGALNCTNAQCQREFPIIDGIPLLIANLRQYVADNILSICGRNDLSEFTESLLGDCCGPNSSYEVTRQHISSYAWDHYGDLDPAEAQSFPPPGSMRHCLLRGLELVSDNEQATSGKIGGPILDAGCSVGRGTFTLAEQTGELVLGVDMHFPMLRLAASILRTGIARYPLRKVGMVYDRREFPARFQHSENVDFWACDVAALPFAAGTFAAATALNVLDCVAAPRDLLVSLGNVISSGGHALLSCPYDWSTAATPVETWLGGHSQRTEIRGSSAELLRLLLRPGAHPASVTTLQLEKEIDSLPWSVRLHDRSVMTYKTHVVLARRLPEGK